MVADPGSPENYMRLELLARPENVALARVAVAAFAAQANFTLADLEEIKLCVSEAVSNVVLHAYPDGPGPVVIAAYFAAEKLVIEVTDQGIGIADVDKAREAQFSTLPDHMGLGFVFMESFMDTVAVDSTPGRGTKITMTRRLPSGIAAGTGDGTDRSREVDP